MINQTCCVTGHRDIPAHLVEHVKQALCQEVRAAVADGYRYFLSGFAGGVDLFFAEIVGKMRMAHPKIRLEAVIPYRARFNRIMKNPDARVLLQQCTDVYVLREQYTPDVFMNRNQNMVNRSGRVIAVYDGRERDGTLATMRMARAAGRDLHVIRI